MKIKINIKNLIFKIFKWYYDKSPLLSNTEIYISELRILLSETFKTNFIFISDLRYKTISKNMLEKALKTNFIKYIQYRAENFDCDDYSFILCGQIKLLFPNIAFGIMQSQTHAYNFAILEDKSPVIIEPQTNKIYSFIEFKDKKEYYPARVILI